MKKIDLHGQINQVWQRIYFAVIVVCLTAPFAIIPWLKDMGIASLDLSFVQWLWRNTPELNQEITVLGIETNTTILTWIALGLFILGVLYFSSKFKHLELLESFRDEAEKRLRVEGYMKKERDNTETKI